jgi:hypothetical protein
LTTKLTAPTIIQTEIPATAQVKSPKKVPTPWPSTSPATTPGSPLSLEVACASLVVATLAVLRKDE